MPDLIENTIQKEAICFPSGVLQVLAGPGSGKTFVMIQRIKFLIEQEKVKPENILVITFTKAAAEEMRQRFYQLMDGKMLPVCFGTFHAVFYHILRQTGQYQGYSLIREKEKRKLLKQLFLMLSKNNVSEEKISQFIQIISQIKNEAKVMPQSFLNKKELQFVYEEYNAQLREQHKLDFDDMGLLCLKLLEAKPELLKKWQMAYPYILIDEFQDSNEVQYKIVQKLAGENPNLFVVGDDDQSIYGFRGARADMMQRFMEHYPQAKQLLLNTNYRCHEDIVCKSQQIIAENKIRFPKEMKAVHRQGEGVVLKAFEKKEQEMEWLLTKCAKVSETTAIIYRTNYECSLLAEKLIQHHIPFQMKEKIQSPYEHFAVKDCMTYLSLANEGMKREHFHLIMNRPLRYLKKDCARAKQTTLSEVLNYYHGNALMQKTAIRLFDDLKCLSGKKPYLALQYIRKVIGYDAFLTECYGIEEGKKIQQILEEFQTFSKEYKTYQEMRDYISQYNEQLEEKNVRNIRNTRNTTETDTAKSIETKGVHLMTMHASKGLEFDTVYLPDLNEGKMPMRQVHGIEEMEEERRMLYVAMTRAKQNLYLMFCQQKTGKDVPSRFLKPLYSESTISSNSTESKYSSKASSTASYSSSSSIYSKDGSSFGLLSSSK